MIMRVRPPLRLTHFGTDVVGFGRTEQGFDGRLAWLSRPDRPLPEGLHHLPTIEIMRRYGVRPTDWEDYVTTPLHDPWWQTHGYLTDSDRFATPALHVNSWYDFGADVTAPTLHRKDHPRPLADRRERDPSLARTSVASGVTGGRDLGCGEGETTMMPDMAAGDPVEAANEETETRLGVNTRPH
jgi:hypothetical protein